MVASQQKTTIFHVIKIRYTFGYDPIFNPANHWFCICIFNLIFVSGAGVVLFDFGDWAFAGLCLDGFRGE